MIRKVKHIGDFRQFVTFQVAELQADGIGGQTEEWVDLVEDWIRLRPVSGRQKLEQMAQKERITHVISARYRADLDLLGYADGKYNNRMRIVYEGRVFNIQYVINEDEYRAFFEMGARE